MGFGAPPKVRSDSYPVRSGKVDALPFLKGIFISYLSLIEVERIRIPRKQILTPLIFWLKWRIQKKSIVGMTNIAQLLILCLLQKYMGFIHSLGHE